MIKMKKSSRGVAHLAVIIIVIFLAIGVVGYLVYQNSLQVSQSSQNQLTPTASEFPGQTANWKTYTNQKYGFSFEYPPDWPTPTSNDDFPIEMSSSIKVVSPNADKTSPELEINVFESSLSPEEYYKQQADKYTGRLHKYGEGSNNEAFEGMDSYYILVNNEDDIGFDNIIWVKTKDNLLEITLRRVAQLTGDGSPQHEVEVILDRIFYSFKFLPTEEANWKTYTNQDAGYLVKYPADVFVKLICPDEKFILAHKKNVENPYNKDSLKLSSCPKDSRYDFEIVIHEEPFDIQKEDDSYIVTEKSITLDSLTATKYYFVSYKDVSSGPESYTMIVVNNNSKTYEIYFENKELENVYNQVLSTFEFLD